MAARDGYLGRAPGDSAVTVATQIFTPSSSTTTFTFAAGYVSGYLDVYLNGIRLIYGTDYTAGDGSTVVLTSAAQSGDTLEMVAYKAFNVGTIDSAAGNFSVGGDLTVTGNANITGDVTYDEVTGVNINVTGIATVGSAVTINSTGIEATSGVVTASAGSFSGTVTANSFSGSGSNLTGVANTDFINATQLKVIGVTTSPQYNDATGNINRFYGVGIHSGGTIIGTGVTILNFVGTGNTAVARSGNQVDISISGSSGGGGAVLDITACLFV